jgi:hypothetical protein
MRLVGRVEEVGRVGRRADAHPHVEERALAEGEAPTEVIDLVRRDPEVEQDARVPHAGERRHGVHVGVVREHGTEAAGRLVGGEARARRHDRLRVAVDAGDVHPGF